MEANSLFSQLCEEELWKIEEDSRLNNLCKFAFVERVSLTLDIIRPILFQCSSQLVITLLNDDCLYSGCLYCLWNSKQTVFKVISSVYFLSVYSMPSEKIITVMESVFLGINMLLVISELILALAEDEGQNKPVWGLKHKTIFPQKDFWQPMYCTHCCNKICV